MTKYEIYMKLISFFCGKFLSTIKEFGFSKYFAGGNVMVHGKSYVLIMVAITTRFSKKITPSLQTIFARLVWLFISKQPGPLSTPFHCGDIILVAFSLN